MDYISTQEAAEKWGITENRVQKLCAQGLIDGQARMGHMWLIQRTPLSRAIHANREASVMLQIQIKPAKLTSTLLRRLFKASNMQSFVESNAELLVVPSFHDYIRRLCREAGIASEQVIRQAGLDRTYGHQIFSGRRHPSRDKVIQLAFGFGLDVDGAQELLKLSRKSALYPFVLRDAVILRCLNDHIGIIEAQSFLHELGLTLLGGDKKNE